MFQNSLELDLLLDAQLCASNERTRFMKLNTNNFYRQQKYNLLREESEGYAKLVVILASLPVTQFEAAESIKQILSLIGYFDLDPNRVLDVTLDAFEQQPWNPSFAQLLGHFRRENISHFLGMKFCAYHSGDSSSTTIGDDSKEAGQKVSAVPPKNEPTKATVTVTKSVSAGGAPAEATSSDGKAAHSARPAQPTPATLYSLAAVLLAYELVALDELLPYLQPTADDIGLCEWQAELERARFDSNITCL